MHNQSLASWQHDHTFGQDQIRTGERKTLIVIAITGLMMVWEIVSGLLTGSMALLADGIHMASHTAALGISVLAYLYARKKATDPNFSFGTGKVNSLAGFTSAILLMVFAFSMVVESIKRLFNPVEIAFNQALIVAGVGLAVNLICTLILRENTGRHVHDHPESHSQLHSDHNLRSAYLHVLADAATSLTAIFALLGGKFFGWEILDPIMGFVGAALVLRWSWSLIRVSSDVLLDKHGPQMIRQKIVDEIERQDGNKISDIHLWLIGPGIYAAVISIVTENPKAPEEYKKLIPDNLGIAHSTIEVHPCNPC